MNIGLPISNDVRPATPGPAANRAFDFRALLNTLVRHIRVIIALPIVLGALGYGVTKLLPKSYTSQTFMMIEPRRPGSVGPEGEFALVMVDSAKVAGVLTILESTVLLERVVTAERLADDAEFGAAPPGLVSQVLQSLPFLAQERAPAALETRQARAIAQLRRAIRVVRIGVTYIIRIDVTTRDAAKSQRLANAVVDAYLADQLEAKYEATRRGADWLRERLVSLRDDLIRAEREVEAVRAQYGLTEIAGGGSIGQQAMTELNVQLIAAQGEVANRQARLDQALRATRGSASLEGLNEVTSSSIINTLRTQQSEHARRLAELQSRFGPRHPEVQRAEESRRALEQQLGAEVQRIVAGLRNDFETSVRRRDALEQQVIRAVAEQQASNVEGAAKLREAQRVAEAAKGLYDSFLTRFNDLQQQVTLETVEARIISPADRRGAPSFPQPLPFVAGGIALGILAGLGLAFVLNQLDATFATARALEDQLGVPVLGTMPLIVRRDLKDGGKRLDMVSYVATRPLSRFAEGVRGVRVGVRMSNVDKATRVLQVTSAVPGEGKSTMAAAIAVSAATAGQKVIILDTDFRHLSISKMFAVRDNLGLAEYLVGDKDLAAVTSHRDDLKLDIIGTGAERRTPADVLGSRKFRDLVERLAGEYDLVVIDTPPLLALSDARIVAELADASLLVVEWRSTQADIVEQAAGLLRMSNGRFAGTILNKVDFRKMRRYGYGYGYGYAYGGYGRYYNLNKKYYTG
ncbi:MAG: polysaccharide biosynthesis tyrosine autokinase [Acetobacteraceae bacterium]|nr:polysaccharide biosynthesis tyrosine autokinase [Acetobacteraceae bacterium]